MEISKEILSLRIPRNAQLILTLIIRDYACKRQTRICDAVALGMSRKTAYNNAVVLQKNHLAYYNRGRIYPDMDSLCEDHPEIWQQAVNGSWDNKEKDEQPCKEL